MKFISKILAPVDVNEDAPPSLTHAVRLAKELDAHLTLLYVVDYRAVSAGGPEVAFVVDNSSISRSRPT